MNHQAPGVAPPGPKVAASLAGMGVYVQGATEVPLPFPPRWTSCPGVVATLFTPTLTVAPPSDAELEFVAAQANKAPWVPTSAATTINTFDRRLTRPPQSRPIGRSLGSA